MPTSLWHLATCDPFHIICLNGHNYPGLPMVIEVSQEQQCEVRITCSLGRGWVLDATLASRCLCFSISSHFNEILLTVHSHCTNNVWLNVKMLFYMLAWCCTAFVDRFSAFHCCCHLSKLPKWNANKIFCVEHIFTCCHIMNQNVRLDSANVFNVLQTRVLSARSSH